MFDLNMRAIPTHEIDRAIEWAERVKSDCDYRIYELEKIKKDRARSAKHREAMNFLAMRVHNANSNLLEVGDEDVQITYIQNLLACEIDRAKCVLELLTKWSKRKQKKDRDYKIAILVDAGMKKTEVADICGVSRQYVYVVLKKHEGNALFK